MTLQESNPEEWNMGNSGYWDGYSVKESNFYIRGSPQSKAYGQGWLEARREDIALYGVASVPVSEGDTFLRVR